MSDEQKITLISNDSRRIEVPLDVARMSAVIAGQINDDDEDSEIENEFPCPKVSGNILQKVVDYCTHYQEEPMEKIETPLKGETIEAIVRPEWYVRFCDVDREVMCQLVAAANFLNIEPLLDLTCLAVSVSVKGKSVEELQEIFHLPAPDNSSLSVNASEQSQEENHQEESGTHNDKEASVMETATSSNTSTTTSNNISHNNTNNNNNSNISISKKRTHAVANLKGDDSHDHHDPQRLKQQTTTKKSLTAKQEQSSSTWEKILKQYPRCCAATGIEETSVFRNKYQEPSTFSGNHKNSNYLRILMSELANLQETLPQSPAIWVRFDEDVPQYLRILITGPRGTPYSLGLFCFDLFVPTNYPNAPPVMKLLTTGRGTVRFSPNLYANGTVCLSLLNTWEGPKWRANQSTILQVLVSIQALILGTEHPYYLEPGRGGWEDGVKQQQQQLQQQQNGKDPKPRPPPVHVLIHEDRIREGTLQYALLDMVRQQSTMTSTTSNSNSCDKYLECFQEIIQAHFYHYRQEMVETVEQWAKSWNAQSVPKNKLDKHVEQFREVVWKLKCPDFLDETVAASSQQQQQEEEEEEDGIVLDNTKDDANTSARKDNVFLSLTRSQMEQAAAKGDYITAGRLQLEMKNVQKHGNVASIIATKRQQMEDRASLKDYIGAGEIQKELHYLEQHQTMLCDLEKRMFDAAWKMDFCKAGKIQQQYQLLLQTSSKDEQQLENAAAWRSGVVASTSSMPVGSNPKVMPTDGMWPEEEEEEEHDDEYYDEEDMDEMHQVLFGLDGVYQGNY